ncbi:hypothetical protein EPK99_06475 [Neorhizobium lilium]|uniref:Uncharacterized protein n=1 Tax=Neorhizobium lilium TaxID=2503024 RepID=A0A444LH76_9HYPH|nr:hypothetical protein [Neorhizobium lilium]RWX78274.1 hypothetical protein EPK99_06475 [Neorhizobium lilium]
MSALGYSAAVGQAALDALNARLNGIDQSLASKADALSMPSPATAAPNMITDTNTTGTGVKYAREDHTHKSNVQAKRVQVVGSAGQAVWNFTTAFDAAPVVTATAETPLNAAYTNVATVLEGSISMTSATIVVHQVVKSITLSGVLTSLLGSVLILFGFAPANTYVNCSARKPS